MGSLWQIQCSSSQFCHGLHFCCLDIALMSQLTQSIHLCFGLSLLLLPCSTVSSVCLPTYSWSRLFMCPNCLRPASRDLSTFSLSLMLSFRTWSPSVSQVACPSTHLQLCHFQFLHMGASHLHCLHHYHKCFCYIPTVSLCPIPTTN